MIRRLVVFGASGDLTGRFLLPALAQLSAAGQLPTDFAVTGAAREPWDDDGFRRHAEAQLGRHAADVPADGRAALLARLRYRVVDVTDQASVGGVIEQDDGPLAAYLALPTGLIPSAVSALGAAGLPPGSRVAVEKPFGEDVDSAISLNGLLADTLGEGWEQAVFRVDHVLGMTSAQNLLALRFANRIPDVLLSSEHVAEVEVLWEETLALEGRAGFYDRAGALRDVVQNHMVQLLCLVAMEGPDAGTSGDVPAAELRRLKVELLRAVRVPSVDDVIRTSRRARYTTGTLADSGGADGRRVPDYTAEDGVDRARQTETFAEVELAVETDRWSGTPFRLRAGKALAARRKGVLVRFRPPVGGTGDGGRLWLGIDGPDDISLTVHGLSDGAAGAAPLTLTGHPPAGGLSPYARVLQDLLRGGSALSVGGEEAEQAWRILTPVRQAWDDGLVPMQEYPAGSGGPAA